MCCYSYYIVYRPADVQHSRTIHANSMQRIIVILAILKCILCTKTANKKLLFTIFTCVFGFSARWFWIFMFFSHFFVLSLFCASNSTNILEGEPLHCIQLLILKTTGRFTPLNLNNFTQCVIRCTFDIHTKITPRSYTFGIVIVSSIRLYLNRTFEPIQMPQARNLFRKTTLDKPF